MLAFLARTMADSDESSADRGCVPAPAGRYDPVALEAAVAARWRAEGTFARSVEQRRGAEPFVFLEGPPTANGLPGIHHVLARTYKDLVCRWKTMQGRLVERKGGWDTHGLPVEIEVQRRLDLGTNQEIIDYGMEKFNAQCRESVWKYEGEWRRMTERMGFWIDMDNPYVTLHDDYIESGWWSLKQMWDKGLLYQDYKVLPFCPQTGTSYSSHEVALGYNEVTEPSIFVKFRLVGDRARVLAWTTTPWTLPGNVGLAVHPEVTYCRVRVTAPPTGWEGGGGAEVGEEFIMAKELLSATLRHQVEIVAEFPGAELVGRAYEPLFPGAVARGDSATAWTLLEADFVTTTDGTGVVHTAVMYGEDDFVLGRAVGLPEIHTVDADGSFVAGVHPRLDGRYVKDCDGDIIALLDEAGLLYRTQDYTHDYPHCWRTGHPLLYYAMTSWFVRMSSLREPLIAHNDRVTWAPDWVGQKRFGEWLENVKDWAVSRERFWGTPLPIWSCACGHRHCIGSRAELAELARDPATVPDDLHRPFVDDVEFDCPECGGVMRREPYVLDCWFDSGCAFFAQWHHPFEHAERFAANFPVDFISEAMDQTRGWFYTLLALSTAIFDDLCYRNCLTLGLILDDEGKKMSKSRGNVVDPWDHFGREGADAVRWYLVTSGAPWNTLRFDAAALRESYARFFLTLWNVFRFHTDYAALDGFDPTAGTVPPADRAPLDRWLLSRLAATTADYTALCEAWKFHRAARLLEDFVVGDLSNWYVRRSRRRLWDEAASADKRACQHTLHEALMTVSRLAAPIAPYITDHIHRALLGGASVHLADWPAPGDRDTALEERMALVQQLAEAGRRVRAEAQRRQRLPCRQGWIVGGPDLSEFHALLGGELNVESIAVEQNLDRFQRVELVPNFKVLGRKVRGDLPRVKAALAEADPDETLEALKRGDLELAGYPIAVEDIEVRRVEREGYAAATLEGGVSLVLDMALDDELLSKGLAREIVRRVQARRKELDLAVEAHIALRVWLGDDCPALRDAEWAWVRAETRATEGGLAHGAPTEAEGVVRFAVDGAQVAFRVGCAASDDTPRKAQ